MFKVICIDNKPYHTTVYPEDLLNLIEGQEYTVVRVTDFNAVGYILKEISTKNIYGFWDKRFIPLSNIDELELTNHKEEVVNF